MTPPLIREMHKMLGSGPDADTSGGGFEVRGMHMSDRMGFSPDGEVMPPNRPAPGSTSSQQAAVSHRADRAQPLHPFEHLLPTLAVGSGLAISARFPQAAPPSRLHTSGPPAAVRLRPDPRRGLRHGPRRHRPLLLRLARYPPLHRLPSFPPSSGTACSAPPARNGRHTCSTHSRNPASAPRAPASAASRPAPPRSAITPNPIPQPQPTLPGPCT